MIRSMTGFGRASSNADDITIWAELSSLNHRHLDVGTRLSSPLNIFENEVKKLVQSHIERGRVNVSLTIDGSPPEAGQLEFNQDLARQHIDAARAFANETGLKDDIGAASILRLGSLWSVRIPRPEEMTGLWGLAERALTSAIEQLLEMRRIEGENIWNDLSGRIQQIEPIVQTIAGRTSVVVEYHRERLKQRIDSILPAATELDEQRLLTEVAMFADRADISEELARFESHIQQFNSLAQEQSNVGRRLDFLIQEMFREVTTIGSKARDSESSHAVVEVKGLLEKMREQIQNVE
jgi:uncharacterized protein (TIGR00255 family)